jgi:hypothetical protein
MRFNEHISLPKQYKGTEPKNGIWVKFFAQKTRPNLG